MTVDELKSLNNLTSNALSLGQVLKLSKEETPSTADTYTVKKGDTLYGIANKYGLSVNELKTINDLTTNTLSIGQVLKVKPSMTVPPQSTNTTEYTVKKGDTLYAISRQFGVSVDEIKRENNLTSNALSVGQTLKIPTQGTKVYTVVSGDTLYTIARKNNTTVSEIMNLNNLASSSLSIGQKLLLPN